MKTYHSEILERSRSLNVLERLAQIRQLGLNAALGLLRALDGLGLEGIDGLELAVQVIRRGLEVLEVILDLVDDGLVLQGSAVIVKVDGLRLFRQRLHLAAGVVVALLERLQRRSRLAPKAQGAGHLGPVNLERGTTLQIRLSAEHVLFRKKK